MFLCFLVIKLVRTSGKEGRECGMGRTLLRGEMGCLSERYCAPQDGRTPLLLAVEGLHYAVVKLLLEAKVDTEAKDKVRRQGG